MSWATVTGRAVLAAAADAAALLLLLVTEEEADGEESRSTSSDDEKGLHGGREGTVGAAGDMRGGKGSLLSFGGGTRPCF